MVTRFRQEEQESFVKQTSAVIGVRRILDDNGEVNSTIFPAISDVQLAA